MRPISKGFVRLLALCACALGFQVAHAQGLGAYFCPHPHVVTTFGETTSIWYAGGVSITDYAHPIAITMDEAGNLFVGDRRVGQDREDRSGTIRKITRAGVVTQLAGNPEAAPGIVDGLGSQARFSYAITGLVADAGGNLFVSGGPAIRKVTPAGMVTTVATGFRNTAGIVRDAAGNLYVTDQSQVYKVTSAGLVSAVAGSALAGSADGFAPAATFGALGGIVVTPAGDLYVADGPIDTVTPQLTAHGRTIRRISPSGWVTTIAGAANMSGSVDGPGRTARFGRPWALALDSAGSIFVTDWENHAIRRIDHPNGAATVTTIAGLPDVFGFADGSGSAARFSGPGGLALGPDANGQKALYLTEYYASTLRKISCLTTVSTYGLTFAVPRGSSGSRLGARLSCHGEPAALDNPHKGSCNPYQGDTVCSAPLPVACYRPSRGAEGSLLPLAKAQLAMTAPVVGSTLASALAGSARCEAEFGPGWRMAEFHDGGGWSLDALRGIGLNPNTRAWVHINDQAGNCWGR